MTVYGGSFRNRWLLLRHAFCDFEENTHSVQLAISTVTRQTEVLDFENFRQTEPLEIEQFRLTCNRRNRELNGIRVFHKIAKCMSDLQPPLSASCALAVPVTSRFREVPCLQNWRKHVFRVFAKMLKKRHT